LIQHLKILEKSEARAIEILFREVHARKQGLEYWKWMFDAPEGYIPAGLFDNEGKLLSFYSVVRYDGNKARTYSSMTHPAYRGQRLYSKVANFLYNTCQDRGIDYCLFFSNANIRKLHKKVLGSIETQQVREYYLNYDKNKLKSQFEYYPIFQNEFVQWRYAQHPFHQSDETRYIYYYNMETKNRLVFSVYKNRVQLLDYDVLEHGIGIGMMICHLLRKKRLTFWSEEELDYPHFYLPQWRMYKILNEDIKIEDIIKQEKIRMFEHDAF